ncbi:hypothetical protein ACHAXM_010957 [Skeletonema potamos]|jgi:ESCRT-I complex subunit VPS37
MFSWSKQQSSSTSVPTSSAAGYRSQASAALIPRNVHLSSYLDHPVLKPSTRKVSADDTIYDTVFQTTNGFALIVRVYIPVDVTKAPQMSLHGVIASHSWLDIRMRVIGYAPISSDQSWGLSKLKLGDAVYAVIHHFQLQPPSISQFVDENLARLQQTLSGSTNKNDNATKSRPNHAATSSSNSALNNNGADHNHNNAQAQVIDENEAACNVDEEELSSLIPRVPSNFPEIDEMSLSELNDLVNNKAALDTFIDKISEVNTLKELKESIEMSNVDTATANLALEEKVESICSEVETLKQDLKSNMEKYRELDAQRVAMICPPEIHEVRQELTAAKKKAYNESEEFADDWVESGGSDVSEFVKKFMDTRVLYHTRAAKAERLGMSK